MTKWDKIKEAYSEAELSYENDVYFGDVLAHHFPTIQRFIDAVLAEKTIDIHMSDSYVQRIMQERIDAERELLGD